MGAAPPTPLIVVDEESQLVLLDCSWHDGTLRVLEPLSLDILSIVHASLPGEPPGLRRIAHMAYVELVQLVLISFDGSPAVLAFDAGSGSLRAELGGHIAAPPALRWILRMQRLATLGGGVAAFNEPGREKDCTVRL